MSSFKDRVAIVTGGASGIGRALATQLAQGGAQVILADIDGDGVQRVASELGDRAQGLQLDVTDAEAVAAAVTQVRAEHGRIDLLFNNAGVGVLGEVRDLRLADWHKVLDVNLRGVINGIHAAYPIMIEQGSGHIVNTSSLAGLVPTPGLTPYSAAKHAVVGLSRSLRAEARGLGVKVSVICPGMVQTPILETSPTRALDGDKLRAKLMFGAITPEACARAVLKGVRKNREVILPTFSARVSVFLLRVAPWLVGWIVNRMAGTLREVRQES